MNEKQLLGNTGSTTEVPPPYTTPTLAHPLGLDQQWIAQGQTTLLFPANFSSVLFKTQGDRIITALNGNAIFRIHSSGANVGSARKTIYSCADQRLLFNVHEEEAQDNQTWYLENDKGDRLAVVRSAAVGPGWTEQEASFSNSVGGVTDWTTLTVKGQYPTRVAELCCGDVSVAKISRGSGSAAELANPEVKFQVKIPAGMDIALITGILVAFDFMLEAKRRFDKSSLFGAQLVKKLWTRSDRDPANVRN